MSKPLKIDFVSDVACPWCAIGLYSLEQALRDLGDEITVTLNMQPYELNPTMAVEGVDAATYLMNKYGMSAQQLDATRAQLRARGAEVGFTFGDRSRVWNTFDAHRLLHFAGLIDGAKQRALKHALLAAYHRDGFNPSDPSVLQRAGEEAGLDATEVARVIASDDYSAEVRAAEAHWQRAGINAVPSVIINDRHLLQGGQPAEVFAQALRQIAGISAPA